LDENSARMPLNQTVASSAAATSSKKSKEKQQHMSL